MRHGARFFTPLLTFTLTAVVVGSRGARAQELSVGARVRVSVPDFKIEKRTGTITRLTADSLGVDFGGRRPPLMTSIDRVSGLEVPVGKDHGAGFLHGAGIGTLAGAVVGFGVGFLAIRDCTSGDGPPCELVYILTIPGGAAVGVIVGGIIGVANPPDRWQHVSLRRGPTESGMHGVVRPMRVGLSLSF